MFTNSHHLKTFNLNLVESNNVADSEGVVLFFYFYMVIHIQETKLDKKGETEILSGKE